MSRQRPFQLWLGAATLSTLCDSVTFFALGWVASGFGAGAASLVMTVESVPLCLLILVGGVVADRYGVRRVMASCDAAMVVVMAALAIGSVVAVPLWSLVVVGALSGTAAALRRPAEGVFPRLFVGEEELARHLATVNGALQVARIAGPTVGGVLVGLGGLTLTASLDAASFAVVFAVLFVVRPAREADHRAGTGSGGWRGIVDGARAARRTPGVPAALLTVVGLAATVLPMVMLCVPLAGRERGWGAGGTGLVSAGWIAGGLLVTLWVARRGLPHARWAITGPVVAAAAVLVLAVSGSLVAAVLAQVLVGVGTVLLTSHLFPALIAATPPDMLARFQSLAGLAQTGPVLLATPILGFVAEHIDLRAAFVLVALGLALTSAAAVRVTTPSERPMVSA